MMMKEIPISIEPAGVNGAIKTKDTSPYCVLPGQMADGRHILSVLVKRSYTIEQGKQAIRSASDERLYPVDCYYGTAQNSSVKQESDFVPFKLKTDVIFRGKAFAPAGRKVYSMRCSISINNHKKELLLIGDRVCKYHNLSHPTFSDPVPFTVMDIRYENAYGGVDALSQQPFPSMYPRNPVGKGFVIDCTRQAVEGLHLPTIEDPLMQLLPHGLCVEKFSLWHKQPLPQGFGWVSKMWHPRISLAGLMPAEMKISESIRSMYGQEIAESKKNGFEAMQVKPLQYEFFNGASEGLALDSMKGDETVKLACLDKISDFQFRLPGQAPQIFMDSDFGSSELPATLQSVVIVMEEKRLDMVWRASQPYPGVECLADMQKLNIEIA
ncbi:MAG: DUF2169 domain-containing protein [Chitinivibrionales bacterium]|nr:DUF2169 domain-containing protein [Chitinivibrionales bacterium]